MSEFHPIIKYFLELIGDTDIIPPVHNLVPGSPVGAAGVSPYIQNYYECTRGHYPMDLLIMGDGDGIAYFSMLVWTEIQHEAFKIFYYKPDEFKALIDKFERFGNEILHDYEDIKTKIQTLPDKDLAILIDKTINKSKDLNGISWLSVFMDKELCWSILERNNVICDKDRLEEIWNDISTPYFESLDIRRRRKILEEIAKGKTLEEINFKFQYFFQNYDGYASEEHVSQMLEKEYKGIDQQEAMKEIVVLDTELDAVEEHKQKVISSLTPEEQKLFEFIQITIYVRDRRKDYLSAALSLQFGYGDHLCNVLKIDSIFSGYMMGFELAKGKEYIESIKNEIIKRKDGFIVLTEFDDSVRSDLIHNAAEIRTHLEARLLGHKISEQKEIKGTPAFKGKVQGKVRIIRNPKTESLNEGEILVTGMTRPEFIPLMKQALAVVTDEGGVTCHAAIVSRELKIPCITGTTVATRILKDGDLVEVDAEKGIVRIIK